MDIDFGRFIGWCFVDQGESSWSSRGERWRDESQGTKGQGIRGEIGIIDEWRSSEMDWCWLVAKRWEGTRREFRLRAWGAISSSLYRIRAPLVPVIEQKKKKTEKGKGEKQEKKGGTQTGPHKLFTQCSTVAAASFWRKSLQGCCLDAGVLVL